MEILCKWIVFGTEIVFEIDTFEAMKLLVNSSQCVRQHLRNLLDTWGYILGSNALLLTAIRRLECGMIVRVSVEEKQSKISH